MSNRTPPDIDSSEPLAEKLNRAWYGSGLWTYLLAPLALLYWLVVTIRKATATAPKSSRVPVIVVGNITVGGTGKSPLVSCLVKAFQDKGYKVGIVSRGYGANIPKTEVRLVSVNSAAAEVGDEPLMLKRALGCEIALCPSRPLAVEKLSGMGCELIISDDGLQHHAMYRDIEICVVDAERGIGNGWVLPVGPLREPASRLEQVDYIVLNGQQAGRNHPPIICKPYEMHLLPSDLENIETGERLGVEVFLERFADRPTHLVAAIGNPKRFFATVEHLGMSIVSERAFTDHHVYTSQDFDAPNELILMTEKDAVKCHGLGLSEAWFLRVKPELQDNFIETIYNRLLDQQRLSRNV